MCFTHPLQLEAEGLIPAQPVGGGPARPANRSAVQAQHGTNFHWGTERKNKAEAKKYQLIQYLVTTAAAYLLHDHYLFI